MFNTETNTNVAPAVSERSVTGDLTDVIPSRLLKILIQVLQVLNPILIKTCKFQLLPDVKYTVNWRERNLQRWVINNGGVISQNEHLVYTSGVGVSGGWRLKLNDRIVPSALSIDQ